MEEVGVEDETRQHRPIGRDGERVFSVEESAEHQTDREREDGAEGGRVGSVVEVRTHLRVPVLGQNRVYCSHRERETGEEETARVQGRE